uniref:tRNA:m(4)X modification enzyme TRM13 n=1 Tax=Corethrella appendiculata TaxID=1370023 RepID=U5EU63_9DIPT
MSNEFQPEVKKLKTTDEDIVKPAEEKRCKFFVQRKKRFCKITVGKTKEYCGEHEVILMKTNPENDSQELLTDRIPCPYDPKHSVYQKKLTKHLRICNSRPKDKPKYISTGLNARSSDDDDDCQDTEENSPTKLSEIDVDIVEGLILKIENLYKEFVEGTLEELILENEILREECKNPIYGAPTLKHLLQTSSILGYLKHFNLLDNDTSYVEFGAGRGIISYWLGKTLLRENYSNNQVLLIDKASHRHKKDNRIGEINMVQRIRADISDLVLLKLDKIDEFKKIICVSKHLCGAATDLTLRCVVNSNKEVPKIEGCLIALCCHHRCTWKTFVGKKFFQKNGFDKNSFEIVTKMVGWAICGDGMSREKRSEVATTGEIVTGHHRIPKERRMSIGIKCKRIIDYARLQYLKENGFQVSLKYYVKSDITLENVCLVAELVKCKTQVAIKQTFSNVISDLT